MESILSSEPSPINILTLSAPTNDELDFLIDEYKNFLRNEGDSLKLSDIAYSTNTNSSNPHRLAVVGRSREEIASNLEKRLYERESNTASAPTEPGKICFLFNGNGSTYYRMGLTLYNTVPFFKSEVLKHSAMMESMESDLFLKEALYGDDPSLIENPVYSGLTLELINYVTNTLWRHWGINPSCVLGHSFGEYGAALAAEILSPAEAGKFAVGVYGQALFSRGNMAAVAVDEKTLDKLMSQCLCHTKGNINSWISIAGKNSECQHVVAAHPETMPAFLDLCKNNGVRVFPLPVEVAYHSQGVDSILPIMDDVCNTITFNEPSCSYISGCTGGVLERLDKTYWSRHLRSPFKFSEATQTAYDSCGARIFIEMGGQPVLSALVMQNADEQTWSEPVHCLQSMRKGKDDMDVMLNSLAKLYVLGYPINWDNFYEDLEVQTVSVPVLFSQLPPKSFVTPLPDVDGMMTEDTFWSFLLQQTDTPTQTDTILGYIFAVMRRVLKSDSFDLDPDQEFRSTGIDSLQAIQMKTQLQKVLGSRVSLSFNDLIECYTPHQLALKLHQLIFKSSSNNCLDKDKEITKQLVKEDGILRSHISAVPDRPPVPLDQIKTFLVTGATGNLAPFIILELAKRPETERIYCLVREGKDISAHERLEKHLKEEGIWGQIDTTRVIGVKGNIVEEMMGMGVAEFTKLAEEVDAVINCAVTSNHLARYKKEDLKYGGVRAVNVIGVERMLEFCSTSRTKWVYHASTFLAFISKKGVTCSRLPEEWPASDLTQELDTFPNFGYSISKIIADQLIHQATQRGIPCKAFRFVKIGGDTVTGRQKVMQNHFFLKFLHYIVSGTMPDLDVPLQLMPVDTCAQVSLRVFFDERANPSDMYNLVCPYAINELEIVDLVEEFGPQLRILSQLSRLVEKHGEDGAREKWLEMTSSGPLSRVVLELDKTLGPSWWENPSVAFSNENVMEFIRSQFAYEMNVVPYSEYIQHLISDGEDSLIYHWIDFYTSKDSLYYIAEKGEMPLQDCWNKNQKQFLRWGKVELLYPNLKEMVESPWDTLKRDIQYTIDNARDIFRNRFKKL